MSRMSHCFLPHLYAAQFSCESWNQFLQLEKQQFDIYVTIRVREHILGVKRFLFTQRHLSALRCVTNMELALVFPSSSIIATSSSSRFTRSKKLSSFSHDAL